MYRYKYQITFRPECRKKTSCDGIKVLPMHNIPVIADITFRGKRLCFYTGIRINREDWVDEVSSTNGSRTQYVCYKHNKRTAWNTHRANDYISEIKKSVHTIFLLLEEYGIEPTPQRVRVELRKRLHSDNHKLINVCNAISRFIKEESVRLMWKPRTIDNYKVLQKHCLAYQENATTDDICEQWLDGFVHYLYSYKRLRNSTISQLLQQLKAVIRWLVRKNFMGEDDKITGYKARLESCRKDSNIIALTMDELETLYHYKPRNKREEDVRNIFCLCSATSLRYSDAMRVRWCNISNDIISIVTQKTNENISIPINSLARNIISHYSYICSHNKNHITSKVLPNINRMSYNRCLKNIARRAGLHRTITRTYFVGAERHDEVMPLYKRMSSHVARKTFVTHGLSSGVPADVIRSFTGHRDNRQLRFYCHFSPQEQKKWMDTMQMNG